MRGLIWLGLAASLAGACAPSGAPEATREPSRDGAPMETGLAASIHADTHGDSVRFTLQVTNVSGAPLPLTFSSGQTHDFVVRQGEREVWRWSADMMFTQAIREETLAPEETRTYSATWTPPAGTSGRFAVEAMLTAQQAQARQRTEFELR